MVNLFHDLGLGNEELTEVNAIIETSKDSMVKYEFDKNLGCIVVDRVVRTPIPYNFNYGLLPQTWNKEDDKPLDIVVLSRFGFISGSVVPCRIVGGLKMIDCGEFDYKVIAVSDDKYYDDIKDIKDVLDKEKEDIYYFMNHYKDLQGKKIKLDGWDNKKNAIKIVRESLDYYLLNKQ